jgi:hypothetical protein
MYFQFIDGSLERGWYKSLATDPNRGFYGGLSDHSKVLIQNSYVLN